MTFYAKFIEDGEVVEEIESDDIATIEMYLHCLEPQVMGETEDEIVPGTIEWGVKP